MASLPFFIFEFLLCKNSSINDSRHPAGPAGQWRPCHFLALRFCFAKTQVPITAGIPAGPAL
jgi:hypothetical protein